MDARLVGVWDDERRAAGAAAFAATRLSYAASTWSRVETRLDAYTQDWLAARIAACEATRRGEQSGDLLDRRMLCLDERLARVEATVELFASADATVVDNAIRAVAGLPSLARCADTKALLAELPRPDDPQVAARVEALEGTLLEVDALYQAGRFEAGLALAETVLHDAEPLGYAPLQVRAQQHRGELLEELGDYEAAELALQQAYVDALRSGMTREAALASSRLIYVVGYRLARVEDGRRWAMHAEPLAEASGADEPLAELLDSRAALTMRSGEFAAARPDVERALAIHERTLGPDHPEVAKALANLGIIMAELGQLDVARTHYERSLAIRERAFGPDHPQVASALSNLGRIVHRQGDLGGAITLLEGALVIRERALGPTHPLVASTLGSLGDIAREGGELDEARAYYERALAIEEPSLGIDHPDVAKARARLAELVAMQKR
jgi:serine/threonine-protein kinase